jgi:hypothetical protein
MAMKDWIFIVAMSEAGSGETVGWVGVDRMEGHWFTSWYASPTSGTSEWPGGEGELFYRGESVDKAKESCLELIKLKEAAGYRLSFPVRLSGKGNQGNPQLTVLDYYCEQHYNAECFDELRRWRFKVAQEKRISAFIIASNRLLKQMATFLPYDESEAKELSGMGENRWKQHGLGFISVTQKYEREHDFPLNWVEAKVSTDDFAAWKEKQLAEREEKRLSLQEQKLREQKLILESLNEGLSLEGISKNLSQSPSMVLKKIGGLSEEGYDILPWLESEIKLIDDRSEIISAAQELGTTYAKPVFARLYEGVPNEEAWVKYDQIRTVFAYLRSLKPVGNEQVELKEAVIL